MSRMSMSPSSMRGTGSAPGRSRYVRGGDGVEQAHGMAQGDARERGGGAGDTEFPFCVAYVGVGFFSYRTQRA